MAIYDPDADATNTKVSIGSTSTLISNVNRNRKFLVLVNDSNEDIYIALGSTAVMNEGLKINASTGTVTINSDYTGKVYGICSSGGKNLTKVEG